MNKLLLYISTLGVITLSAGCSNEGFNAPGEGQGKLVLIPEVNTEVAQVVVSRATDNEDLLKNLNLVLRDSRGESLNYWNNVTGIPWEDQTRTSIVQTLDAGTYTIEGWTGENVPASWDQRYFSGSETFEIKVDEETEVNLTCKIANTAVAVEYNEKVEEVLNDYTIVVTSSAASLKYVGRDDRTGYFLFPDTNRDLEYTLTGTKNDGGLYTKTDKIPAAKAATKYTIVVSYNDPEPTGASAITVKIDETPLEEDTHTVSFRTRPEIKVTSTNGDIELGENHPYSRATGDVGDFSLTVASSGMLKSVSVSMPGLTPDNLSIAIDPEKDGVEEDLVPNITGTLNINEENAISSYKIHFSEEFTKNLDEGDYRMIILAEDYEYEGTPEDDEKSNEALFRLIVSNDGTEIIPATQDDIDAITPTSLVFRGSVVKEDVDEVGFYYRKEGEEKWEYIAAEPMARSIAPGSEFVQTVAGLQQGATYEYAAAFNQKRGIAAMKLSTPNPQLPNAGFEEWQTSTPNLIYASGSTMFWDSGNHGSATMKKNVTTPSSSIKHGGQYSAMLKSQFVGVMTIGKFAAGNIFIGAYLDTDGTDGVLGWGRKFEGLQYRPKQLKGYVKYTPATVGKYTNNNAPDIVNGQLDKGIIYIALLNEDCSLQGNGTYPVEVRTKDAHLFDKTASNVIAYGELVFDKATEGNGMIEFTIDLDYRSDIIPTYIMITASASKGGDYFAGADGSVMYLDDLELVY